MFFIRLTRIIPFLIFLCVLAVLIYLIARFRLPSARAKQVVIVFFTGITGVLSAVLAIITLYGFIDGSTFAVELFGSFLVAALIGLVIVRICNWRFLKAYPQYKDKPLRAQTESPFQQIASIIADILRTVQMRR